jgi:hypothetical protein
MGPGLFSHRGKNARNKKEKKRGNFTLKES